MTLALELVGAWFLAGVIVVGLLNAAKAAIHRAAS